MAITHDYVSWSTGNDYKGATFTDGAFTVADMTLTKAGAFTASKANHWLYLTDNGSNNVTDGYYRIASVTSANAVVLATSPKSGATDPTDVVCTQHAGTALLPWRSDQGACDLLTRNTTDGNQVNIKAGAAVVHAAALDLTTLIAGGALSTTAPLIMRGYTSTANDGGFGEVDCGGATMFAASTYDYVILADLYCHTFGDNNGIYIDQYCIINNVKISKGGSSPTGKTLVYLGQLSRVEGCYVYDGGAGAAYGIRVGNTSIVQNNYVALGSGVSGAGFSIYSGASCTIINNIMLVQNTGSNGIYQSSGLNCANIIYNTTAGTAQAIYGGFNGVESVVSNNIIVGFSGVGGDGISGTNVGVVGYNAFYNNTNKYLISDQIFIDLTANDVDLAADPFTDAANGDFSLTTAAKTALADKGFPGQYLGAHANTDSHRNIGPIQMAAGGAAGGGFPILGGSVVR